MEQAYRWFVTATVIFVITVQAGIVFTRSGEWYWPFLDYPMYSKPRYAGDESHIVEMQALNGEGAVPLDAGDFGLAYHAWLYGLGYPLARGEPFSFAGLESGEGVARWLSGEQPALHLEALRVVDHIYVLGRGGLVLRESREKVYRP